MHEGFWSHSQECDVNLKNVRSLVFQAANLPIAEAANNAVANLALKPPCYYRIRKHIVIPTHKYYILVTDYCVGTQASPHFLLRFTWRLLRHEGFTCVYRLRSRKTAGISE